MDCNCKLPDGGCGLVSSLTRHREPVAVLLPPCSSAHTPAAHTPPRPPLPTLPCRVRGHPRESRLSSAHPQAGRSPSARHWHPPSWAQLLSSFLLYVCHVCLPLIKAPRSRAQHTPCVQTPTGLATKRQAVRQSQQTTPPVCPVTSQTTFGRHNCQQVHAFKCLPRLATSLSRTRRSTRVLTLTACAHASVTA